MPNPVLAIGGLKAGTSILGARSASRSASRAADAQVQAAMAGIEEQRRQFDAVRETLAPFVEQGTDAIQAMGALAGIQGAAPQQEAITALRQGPEFQNLMDAGSQNILAQASATGGLRGGNVQRALGELGPAVLSGVMSDQYNRLGALAGLGQGSAAGQAAAAQTMGSNVANLMGQVGAAQAGGALARGQAFQQGLGGVGQAAGYLGGFMPEMPEGATIFGKWGF